MIRVVLVDDHAVFRSSLRLRLEHEDGIAPVGEAGTAEQAIARARVLKPDVVLIDLLLPRKSGYQAIPEILSASPESRILVVSSQTGPTPVRQAISAGAHGYVPKRASDTEVIEAIRRVAAGERQREPIHRTRERRSRRVLLSCAILQSALAALHQRGSYRVRRRRFQSVRVRSELANKHHRSPRTVFAFVRRTNRYRGVSGRGSHRSDCGYSSDICSVESRSSLSRDDQRSRTARIKS